MALQKPTYSIILDTNALFYGIPLRKDFISFFEKYKDTQQINAKYYIPELVAEELKKNTYRKYKEFEADYLSGQKEIQKLFGISLPSKIKDKDFVLKQIDKAIKKHKIKIIKTPYETINLKSLTTKAVWYELPFEESREKGFKDSIIAETIAKFLENKDLGDVVFISHDDKLRDYCVKAYKNKKLIGYKGISRFETEVRLRLLKIQEKHKGRLIGNALNVFKDSPEFSNDKLLGIINQQWPEIFTSPKATGLLSVVYIGESWEQVSELGWTTDQPELTGDEKGILSWQSPLVISKSYQRKSPIVGTVFGYSGGKRLTRFEFKFNVEWTSKLSKEDEILEPKLTSIIHKRTEAHDEYSLAPLSEGQNIYGNAISVANLSDFEP